MGLFNRHDDYVSPFDTDDTPDYVNPDIEASRINQQVDAAHDQRGHITGIRQQRDANTILPHPTEETRGIPTPIRRTTNPVRLSNRRPRQSKKQAAPITTAQPASHDQTYDANARPAKLKHSGFATSALTIAIIAAVNFGETVSMVLSAVAVALAIIAISRTGSRSRRPGRGMAVTALVIAVIVLIAQAVATVAIRMPSGATSFKSPIASIGNSTEHGNQEDDTFTATDQTGTIHDYDGNAYDVTIDQAAYGLTENPDGVAELIVSFTVTNHSDESWPLAMANVNVLQNGVAVDRSFGFDNTDEARRLGFGDADDLTDIEADSTRTVTAAFIPQDTSSPILVYASGVNDAVRAAYTFPESQQSGSLTPIDADDVKIPQAGESERDGMTTMVDYDGNPRISLRFDSMRQGPRDYEGNKTVMLTLTWINETDRPYSLADLGALDLTQDDHTLDKSYIDDSMQEYDDDSMRRMAMPGVLRTTTVCYTPSDIDGSFDVSFDAYSSFDDVMEDTFTLE